MFVPKHVIRNYAERLQTVLVSFMVISMSSAVRLCHCFTLSTGTGTSWCIQLHPIDVEIYNVHNWPLRLFKIKHLFSYFHV